MEILEKLALGVGGALIAALIFYAFKLRQLYLLVPKLFAFNQLSDKGKIIELRAFNKGRAMEEDVQIVMPPSSKYELIAADHPDVKLELNKIVVARLGPQTEISIVVLAEGDVGSEGFAPSLSSKTTKGRIVKTAEEVLPNAGNVVLGVGGFVLLTALGLGLPAAWFSYQREKETERKELEIKKFSSLTDQGWVNIERYTQSEFAKSYSPAEFPLLLTGASRSGNVLELKFLGINKTATVLPVTAYLTSDEKGATNSTKSVFDLKIQPLASTPFTLAAEISEGIPLDKVIVFASFKLGKDNIFIRLNVANNPLIATASVAGSRAVSRSPERKLTSK